QIGPVLRESRRDESWPCTPNDRAQWPLEKSKTIAVDRSTDWAELDPSKHEPRGDDGERQRMPRRLASSARRWGADFPKGVQEEREEDHSREIGQLPGDPPWVRTLEPMIIQDEKTEGPEADRMQKRPTCDRLHCGVTSTKIESRPSQLSDIAVA